jgi:plastocyanin
MTMAVFGESRICNHLNGSWGDAKVDLSWDQATGISTKANVADMGETGIYMKWSMSSTSLWSPAPTIDQPTEITYIFGTTGHSITWHPSSNVPCNNTIAKDGEEVASANWNGQTITYNVDGLPAGTYVYTCTVNDTIGRRASSAVTVTVNLLPAPTIDQPAATSYTFGTTGHSITWHPSSPWYHNYAITRNETGVASGSWDGQALTCSVDGLTAGTYAYNCTVYDTVGRSASSTVIVRVNLLPAPTIDQPAAITYTSGTTGHSITWNPSSQWYHNYTITRNGIVVASGSWNGQASTCSVDGLTAGTYAYNCTVYDTVGRSASSTVTVTVSAAQQPPEQIPTEVLLSAGGVIAVIVVVGVIVMFRKRR